MTPEKTLQDFLNEEIEKGTFTARAAEGIAQLRTGLAAAKSSLAECEEELANARLEIQEIEKTTDRLSEENAAWEKRENELIRREQECQRAAIENSAATAKAAALEWAMETVFKPSQTRRDIMKHSIVHSNVDGSGTLQDGGGQEIIDEE